MYSGEYDTCDCDWASIPKVLGLIPTVARHIFQACPVWIYTQSNITSIMKNNYKHFTSVNLTYTFNSLTLYSLTLVLSIRILLTTTTTRVDCLRHIAFKLT